MQYGKYMSARYCVTHTSILRPVPDQKLLRNTIKVKVTSKEQDCCSGIARGWEAVRPGWHISRGSILRGKKIFRGRKIATKPSQMFCLFIYFTYIYIFLYSEMSAFLLCSRMAAKELTNPESIIHFTECVESTSMSGHIDLSTTKAHIQNAADRSTCHDPHPISQIHRSLCNQWSYPWWIIRSKEHQLVRSDNGRKIHPNQFQTTNPLPSDRNPDPNYHNGIINQNISKSKSRTCGVNNKNVYTSWFIFHTFWVCSTHIHSHKHTHMHTYMYIIQNSREL